MRSTPVKPEIVNKIIAESGLRSVGNASIREIVKIVSQIQAASGVKFIRMEMGVPGLDSPAIGVQAEIEALQKGVASVYPDMEGLPQLKTETSRFIKNFMNIDLQPRGCVPTVGSMQASMAAIMVANKCNPSKNKTLFIDPGFPVQKVQCRALGIPFETFDVYNFRGKKLREKLTSILSKGDISSIIYSNPNNPSWICFTEEELRIIGDVANTFDVIIIEDLAYFGMDFRSNIATPGVPPYQPTVANYTDNYILLISGSKVFSYAGQRIGVIAMSDVVFKREYPNLMSYFSCTDFGHAVIYGARYSLSAGTAHSTQYALAAMFKSANDGRYAFTDGVKPYGERAAIMKKLFLDNGFYLVYDKDGEKPLADGFYFTINYPGFTGAQLLEELLYYGIGSIALKITGSEHEGLRACVSQFHPDQAKDLKERLEIFGENHPI
ncbi:MAG TPA: pyridoxal phosphate-dependent aminotransferase [Bacteroidales bacterium]|nr:pyridoxal phosphate-dependent aminotransferase [Bacteroidales bacterium]